MEPVHEKHASLCARAVLLVAFVFVAVVVVRC